LFADERAAFDEQRELTRRQLQHHAVVAPQLGERPDLEPLVTRSEVQTLQQELRILYA
jgi:hypothetical protein